MSFGEALQRRRFVPQLVIWIIAFGERQGTLGPALLQLAQTYRRQAELRASLLRTVLPPLLILVMALTFATVFIFGLMAPLWDVMNKFGLWK